MHVWKQGAGPLPVLCLHETGTTSEIWRPLAAELAADAGTIAFDRTGWGESPAPEGYARTTIPEQAGDAARVLGEHAGGPAVVCGAGIGAVVALELMVRRPELVRATVLVEPPLLAFEPEATQVLARDGESVREAVRAGGPEGALELFGSGGLEALGAGAGRIPEALRARGAESARALFAEIAAVPAWELPLAAMGAAQMPSLVVTGADTPAVLRTAAGGVAGALNRSRAEELGPGLPHHDDPGALATLVVEISTV